MGAWVTFNYEWYAVTVCILLVYMWCGYGFIGEKCVAKSVRACLLDIEGTTTSISFVKVCLHGSTTSHNNITIVACTLDNAVFITFELQFNG